MNSIHVGTIRYREKTFSLESEETKAYIIYRSTFDQFLVQMANFNTLKGKAERYKVFVKDRSFYCEFLIGADGFYSKVVKLLGYRKSKFYRSVELFAKTDWNPKEIEINIGLVKRGYLWRFPRGDSASVSIASTFKEDLLSLICTIDCSKAS